VGLYHTVSEIDGDFNRKSIIFPTPMYFAIRHRWRGSPWHWVSAQGVQKLEWWGYQGSKSFKIGLAVYTQYRRVTDRRTDSHLSTVKTALACVARVKRSHETL